MIFTSKRSALLIVWLILSAGFFASAQRLKPEAMMQNGHAGISVLEINPNGKLLAKAFNDIAGRVKPQDSFVFFYAGHGILIENAADSAKNFYLVPHDVTQITNAGGELASKGITANLLSEWTTRIRAGKQLIILDACQSGSAIKAFSERGIAEEKAMLQLACSAGVVILTATGTQQQATEFKRLGHGVFTFALLEGLNGEADGNPADKIITVSEIEGFLDRRVPELTKEHRGTTQYPQRYSRGQDFPLGIN